MKVYYQGQRANHRLFVQPAMENPDAPSEWKEPDGRPKMIEVNFINQTAEVPNNLGNYLIDKGLACKSKPSNLILPAGVA